MPSVGQSFVTPHFYVPQAGHKSFDGEDGIKLAEHAVEEAKNDLLGAREALGENLDLDRIETRIAKQEETLTQSSDPDTRRSVSEESLRLRQELSRITTAPENRLKSLAAKIESNVNFFNNHLRRRASQEQRERFDVLHATATREIARGEAGHDQAELALQGMQDIAGMVSWIDPEMLVLRFQRAAQERYLAIDKTLHDDLVRAGEAAIKNNDMEALREAIVGLYGNVASSAANAGIVDIASIMRA